MGTQRHEAHAHTEDMAHERAVWGRGAGGMVEQSFRRGWRGAHHLARREGGAPHRLARREEQCAALRRAPEAELQSRCCRSENERVVQLGTRWDARARHAGAPARAHRR